MLLYEYPDTPWWCEFVSLALCVWQLKHVNVAGFLSDGWHCVHVKPLWCPLAMGKYGWWLKVELFQVVVLWHVWHDVG